MTQFPTSEPPRTMKTLILQEVDSTNTYGKKHFDELEDGTLIMARHQTAGRGRLNRKWLTPTGTCLTVSFIMKHVGVEPFHPTCCVSMAILDMLREAAPDFAFYVKWPNDIYCGNAKIAGILCEGILMEDKIGGIVAGMGINVNLGGKFLSHIDQAATSLFCLTNRNFDLDILLKSLEKSLNKWYIIYSNSPSLLFDKWKGENGLLGQQIRFILPSQEEIDGKMTEILPDGAIQVESNGKIRVFRTGDIRIAKESIPVRSKTKQ